MRSKATLVLSTIVLVLVLVLIGGILFLKSDYAASRMCNFVRNSLHESLGLSAAIQSCSIDLLPPTLQSRQVQVDTPDGSRLLSVETLRVELDSLALLAGRFRLGKVQLQNPEVHLVLIDGAIANLPKGAGAEPAGREKSQEATLVPEHVEIEGGRLNLVIGKKALLQLRDLRARLVSKSQNRHELVAEIGGGNLDLAGGEGVSYSVKSCKLKAELDAGGLRLDGLFLQVEEATLDVRGKARLEPGWTGVRPEFNVRFAAPLQRLPGLIPQMPPMQGMVEISAVTRTADSGVEVEGDVEVRGFGVAAVEGVNLKAHLLLDARQLRLQNLWLSGPAGWTASGGIQLDLAQPWEFRGSLSLDRVSVREALAMGGVRSPVAARLDGTLGFRGKLKGSVGPYVVVASRLSARDLAIGPVDAKQPEQPPLLAFAEGVLRLEAAVSPRRVRFPSFRLELGNSVLEGEGKIYFHDGAVDMSLRGPKVDPADFSSVAGTRLAGSGSFNLSLSGSLSRPRAQVDLEAKDLWVEDRPVGAVRAQLALTKDRLAVESASIAGRAGRARISGSLDLSPPYALNASVELDAAKLPELFAITGEQRAPVRLEGLLAGSLAASGSLKAPSLDFKLWFSDVRVGEQLFEEGGVLGKLQRGNWHLELLQARMGPGWLFARGEISSDLNLDLAAYSTGLRASSFSLLADKSNILDFRLDLNVTVKGSIASPSFEGWAKVYDTQLRGRRTPDSMVTAKATAESFAMTGRFFGEAALLQADVKLEEGLPFSANLRFASEQLGRFFPELSTGLRSQAAVEGSLQARGRLLSLKKAEGEIRLDRFHLQGSGIRLGNREPVVISVADGGFVVESCQIVGTETVLSVSGEGTIDSGPRLGAKGSVGLGLLPLLGDFLARSVGKANLALSLRGPWNDLQVSGSANFSAELLRFRGFPQDVTSVAGTLEFTPRRVSVTKLRGEMGGGTFTGQGKVEMAAFSPRELALSFEVDGARYNVMKNLWGVGSGVLGLAWVPGKMLKLSGDLKIMQGEYNEHISLVSLSDGIFRRRLDGGRTYAKQREVLELDIRLRAPDRFSVKYNLDLVNYQAEMRGELQVTGTNERLGLIGEMEALGGTVTYLTKDFDIQSTRVQFTDRTSVHPRVEVFASHRETIDRGEEGRTDYLISLRLSAEGDAKPEIILRSEPPLDEHDIVTLLHLGVTSRDVESLKSEDLVGLGGEILFRSFKLDERLRRMFPFPPEVVQAKYLRLRSRFSEKTGTASPRLEVGAKLRLISDNLDLEYGRSLFDDTDQSLDLSYKLSPGISTRVRWANTEQETAPGDIGDLGLDLRLYWEW